LSLHRTKRTLCAAIRAVREPVLERLDMTQTQWRLDIIAQGDRLTDAAMEETGDMNEAKALVHRVVARAMHDIEGPVSRRALDTDMGRALRKRAAAL
jgi:hypothetical protein